MNPIKMTAIPVGAVAESPEQNERRFRREVERSFETADNELRRLNEIVTALTARIEELENP